MNAFIDYVNKMGKYLIAKIIKKWQIIDNIVNKNRRYSDILKE